MTLTECEGFNPAYCGYYMHQSGSGLGHYRGGSHQKGHGLGNILGGLVRGIGPLLQPVISQAKREVARGGMRAIGDVFLRRQPLKTALRNRAMESGHRLLSSTVDRVAGGIKRAAGTYMSRPAKVRRRARAPPAKRKPATKVNRRRNPVGGQRGGDIFD